LELGKKSVIITPITIFFTPAPVIANGVLFMVTKLTTTREVFTEFESIKDKVKTFSNFNTYITVETVRNGYSASKPETYTFNSLNLLQLFYRLLLQLQ
jgi:hypothetical protein